MHQQARKTANEFLSVWKQILCGVRLVEGLRQTVSAHILIWRLNLCVNKKQRGKNFTGIGRMLESCEAEQEGETEAGLQGLDSMQMENKMVRENLKPGRINLRLCSAGELALWVGR